MYCVADLLCRCLSILLLMLSDGIAVDSLQNVCLQSLLGNCFVNHSQKCAEMPFSTVLIAVQEGENECCSVQATSKCQ